jgi:hypothetical protein
VLEESEKMSVHIHRSGQLRLDCDFRFTWYIHVALRGCWGGNHHAHNSLRSGGIDHDRLNVREDLEHRLVLQFQAYGNVNEDNVSLKEHHIARGTITSRRWAYELCRYILRSHLTIQRSQSICSAMRAFHLGKLFQHGPFRPSRSYTSEK